MRTYGENIWVLEDEGNSSGYHIWGFESYLDDKDLEYLREGRIFGQNIQNSEMFHVGNAILCLIWFLDLFK